MNKQWRVGILVFDEVEVLDFAGPFEVLSVTEVPLSAESAELSKPFQVKLVSERGTTVSARNNFQVNPHYSFANAPDFDIIVVPGGWGAREREIHNTHVIDWIRFQMDRVSLMSSVCTGALLLAKAGILNGKRATTHWGSYERLATEFPQVKVLKNVKYVDEGKVITSGGISAGINMSFHIVQRLLGVNIARATAKRMEYDIELTDSSNDMQRCALV